MQAFEKFSFILHRKHSSASAVLLLAKLHISYGSPAQQSSCISCNWCGTALLFHQFLITIHTRLKDSSWGTRLYYQLNQIGQLKTKRSRLGNFIFCKEATIFLLTLTYIKNKVKIGRKQGYRLRGTPYNTCKLQIALHGKAVAPIPSSSACLFHS